MYLCIEFMGMDNMKVFPFQDLLGTIICQYSVLQQLPAKDQMEAQEFDIHAGVLHGDMLAPFLLIIVLDQWFPILVLVYHSTAHLSVLYTHLI